MPSFMNIQVAIIVNDPGNVYIWTIALDAGSSDDKATHFSLCLGTCDICHVVDCCDVCFVLTMILLNVNVQRDTNAPASFMAFMVNVVAITITLLPHNQQHVIKKLTIEPGTFISTMDLAYDHGCCQCHIEL